MLISRKQQFSKCVRILQQTKEFCTKRAGLETASKVMNENSLEMCGFGNSLL